jgi:CheY-like chemotaxis protein
LVERVRILHLDDNALDAELVEETIASDARREWDFVHVTSGPAFEQALEEGGFDLVITDHNIPGYNGRQGIAMARERDATLPVIVVSGSLRAGEDKACLDAGATAVILKDDLESIRDAVQAVLARGAAPGVPD